MIERPRTAACTAAMLLGMLISTTTQAGGGCAPEPLAPAQVADAASTALRTADALDAHDAPVALIARVGQDLSEHGLVYSHAGFAVRDHASGRWSVVHLLNECGTHASGLYVQGLVNFFADDLVTQDARIVWLQPAHAERLASHLVGLPQASLFQPRYNLIARPDSTQYQNSTSWILETLAATQPASGDIRTRHIAYAQALATGFEPDVLRIAYTRRVAGGLFGGNVSFSDHPVATRLSGRYPVVTVRAILGWLERSALAHEQAEWRGGVLQTQPGPG